MNQPMSASWFQSRPLKSNFAGLQRIITEKLSHFLTMIQISIMEGINERSLNHFHALIKNHKEKLAIRPIVSNTREFSKD